MPVRHLYLARHAEPGGDGVLTVRGVQQAQLLGRRLSKVPLDSVQHGPLPRTRETGQVVAGQLGTQVPVIELDAAGDYVPHVPSPDEVDPEHRARHGEAAQRRRRRQTRQIRGRPAGP